MPEVKRKPSRVERRLEELKSALQRLETDLAAELSPNRRPSNRPGRRSSPPSGELEQELMRVKRELAQRRIDLTELRTETARSLQRAEQENERLRRELAAAQRFLESALGPARPGDAPEGASEPPAVSGVDSRRRAETLRPRARGKGG
jgi:hypothetical protein